jgi:pimeloyl-ACP methyl ester carboxylesterase
MQPDELPDLPPVTDDPRLGTERVDVGDLELTCLTMGEGPLALCLHGYPDSAWTWRHLLPRLADAGYRAVAPFNRGYAPSGLDPRGRYQAGVLGVDANALHRELGGDGDAVVIGHDWGAMGAYAAATVEPDRWRAVVAAAVPPGPVTAAAFLSYDQLRLSWYMFFQLTPLADLVVPADGFAFITRLWQDWSPGYDCAADVAAFVACMEPPGHVEAALGYYRQTLRPELQDPELEAAQNGAYAVPSQPLLYLHGADDGCMSAATASGTEAVLTVPGSRFAMIEGAGHFLHLERPDEVNERILSFLAG